MRLALGLLPLSARRGYDRGLPVHRYYIEQFLREFASDISGHCLEFQRDHYTSRFGGDKVSKLDILHKEEGNSSATIVADLTKPNHLPDNVFDCIICTCVLHVILDVDRAVMELKRLLKPGGALLVTVPHISLAYPPYHEFWRFTPEGLFVVLAKTFRVENITMRCYGNSLTAISDLRGLVADELTKAELQYHDESFAVEVCARAIKEF
jgi:SAM-dependent methyltransferase